MADVSHRRDEVLRVREGLREADRDLEATVDLTFDVDLRERGEDFERGGFLVLPSKVDTAAWAAANRAMATR